MIYEESAIQGAKVKRLRVIPDERGRLAEILRRDDEGLFLGFGQVYFTTTYPGVVKAWHMHKKQYDNVACIKGMIKLVMFDARDESPTKGGVAELYIGEHNPLLVQIPAGVYHGWMCVSPEEAYVINVPTEPYDHEQPDEYRLDPHDNDIPYEWHRKDG